MELAHLDQLLLDVAASFPQTKMAARAPIRNEQRIIAADMLRDDHTTATGCYRAAQVLCGPTFRSWEPETVWLTLDRQGIDLSVLNRDKLLAASTLLTLPAFWFEVNAYENTTMAFNDVVSDGAMLQEATPAQLQWAVYEAELLLGHAADVPQTPEFDREPIQYTAIVLHRAGFILAPDLLHFAQGALDKQNKNGANITKADIRPAWKKLQRQDLRHVTFTDSPLDVQLSRLASAHVYLADRLKQYQSDLSRLL